MIDALPVDRGPVAMRSRVPSLLRNVGQEGAFNSV